MKDFYYILGTDVNCTSIEVKEAYRKLSKKFHPDLNQNDKYFENRFREIQEAYEVLNDPLKRKQYDTALNRFKSSQQNTRTSTGESYKTRPSAITKTRRGIDVLFTIILIVITGVFGAYVFKAINAADTVKPKQINTAVATVPVVKPKHHKKRHFVKPEIIADVPKVITPIKPFKHDTLKTHPVQIARVEPKPVKIIAVSNNFLYTTTVKSNVTGVVNMREQDNLSSEVVEAIPGNSQVAVIEKGDRYYKVRYNNNTGYIPKWTLQVK